MGMLGPPLWASTDCDGVTRAVSLEMSSCKFDLASLDCPTPSNVYLKYTFLGDSELNFWNRGVILAHGKVVEIFERYEVERPPLRIQ